VPSVEQILLVYFLGIVCDIRILPNTRSCRNGRTGRI